MSAEKCADTFRGGRAGDRASADTEAEASAISAEARRAAEAQAEGGRNFKSFIALFESELKCSEVLFRAFLLCFPADTKTFGVRIP